jgi:small-conductance mechanosensitive channel
VELGGYEGKVVALNLRDTQMKTPDGKDIFIPNSNIVKNPVVNHTLDHFIREEFVVRLNYSADIGKATSVIQEILDTAGDVLHNEDRAPEVVYHEMSPTSISLLVRYWLDNSNKSTPAVKVKKQLFDRVKEALKSQKISLPADLSEITAQQAGRNTEN